MSLDDECRLLCDPRAPRVVYAIERQASRRGASWVIDFVLFGGLEPVYLRALATAAGFPVVDDGGNRIKAWQVPDADVGHEYRPLWAKMREVVREHAVRHQETCLDLWDIVPRWL